MSAATLMFGRFALKYTDQNAIALRNYVRQSMANRWDDAQGEQGHATCPRIPKRIRQYYAGLLDYIPSTHERYNTGKVPFVESRDIKCVGTCDEASLLEGGYAGMFATALFWSADLPCVYHNIRYTHNNKAWPQCKVDRDTRLRPFLHTAMIQDLTAVLGKITAANSFEIVDFEWGTSVQMNPRHHIRAFQESLQLVYDSVFYLGYTIQCVFLRLQTEHPGTNGDHDRHVIGMYPCHKRSSLAWNICNSWGEECYQGLDSGMTLLAQTYGYTYLNGLSFVVVPNK